MVNQVIKQLSLGPRHTLNSSKTFKMRFPDIGNQAIIRLGNFTQKADLPGMIGSHFNNSDFTVFIHGQAG